MNNPIPVDLSMASDLSGAVQDLSMSGADAKMVKPFNMPGTVDCYSGLTCSRASANPVCCDAPGADGGFSDTCVASSAACKAMSSKATPYECGQAADCGAGMVCCGDIGKSMSGKSFFNSTTCAASCTGTETQLCVTATECKTGTMCVGAAIVGRDVGLCQ
jgi:hypothetical protein